MIRPAVTTYLGLGSNLGDSIGHIAGAIQELSELPDCELLESSSFYKSAALLPDEQTGYSVETQPDYINAVVALHTAWDPKSLLNELFVIERRHQRVRVQHWGPRTLDLDILLYGDSCINEPGLSIPHPEMHKRAFVLYPLYEIAPKLEIPGKGPLKHLIDGLEASEIRKLTTALLER